MTRKRVLVPPLFMITRYESKINELFNPDTESGQAYE